MIWIQYRWIYTILGFVWTWGSHEPQHDDHPRDGVTKQKPGLKRRHAKRFHGVTWCIFPLRFLGSKTLSESYMPPNPNHSQSCHQDVTCFSLQPPPGTNIASRKLCHKEKTGTSHAILLEPAQRAVGMSWHCASLSSLLRFSALPLRGNEAKICFCWGPNWHLQTRGRDRNLRIQSSSKTQHI